MRATSRALAVLAALSLTAQPAAAQSVLRDAETEALLDDMAAPLVQAAGLAPGNVDIVLVNDSSINAFVAGGQAVYINTGLIEAADSAAEVQGVIAHELGHVTGGQKKGAAEGAHAYFGRARRALRLRPSMRSTTVPDLAWGREHESRQFDLPGDRLDPGRRHCVDSVRRRRAGARCASGAQW